MASHFGSSKPEKRRQERRACSGGAEILAGPDRRGQWAVLTDISLSGCYLQTASALPVGTQVQLLIRAFEIEILTHAVVSTCDPGVGMGVEFVNLSPANEARLQKVFHKAGTGEPS